eukprot:1156354-Pelagomonas_calceolata.AAC.7
MTLLRVGAILLHNNSDASHASVYFLRFTQSHAPKEMTFLRVSTKPLRSKGRMLSSEGGRNRSGSFSISWKNARGAKDRHLVVHPQH